MKLIFEISRIVRNVVYDFSYGGKFLGGTSEASLIGSRSGGSTDYGVMPQLFDRFVLPDDVLVDVGCGRGRVLNYWLRRFPEHRMFGIEANARDWRFTMDRLDRHTRVSVYKGDATSRAHIPWSGTFFYLFNPFDREQMRRFVDSMAFICHMNPSSSKRILYYAPVEIDVFVRDRRWEISPYFVKLPKAGRFEKRHENMALIRWIGEEK